MQAGTAAVAQSPIYSLPGPVGEMGYAVRSFRITRHEGLGTALELRRQFGPRRVMAKVYVSSTVIDLKRERRAVLDWLRLARHQAVDSYLPDSETLREGYLDDVAACDLFVLMLGHRYGFQPADGNPDGLSIPHLEFRRAGECGIPRVVLLRTSIPD